MVMKISDAIEKWNTFYRLSSKEPFDPSESSKSVEWYFSDLHWESLATGFLMGCGLTPHEASDAVLSGDVLL